MISEHDIIAICAYFNPFGDPYRSYTYSRFRAQLAIPLLTVELGFNSTFQLTASDTDLLVQISGGDIMWQKERLLNIALHHLPSSCKYVCWLDADILFTDRSWPDMARAALDKYPVVQLFETVEDYGDLQRPTAQRQSVARMLNHRDVADEIFSVCGSSLLHGYSPGHAWAARRDVLQAISFYDALILGGGDKALVAAITGQLEPFISSIRCSEAQASHLRSWAVNVHACTRNAFSYVPVRIAHLWHGSLGRRGYASRHVGFAEFQFNPVADIAIGSTGAWEWSSPKGDLHKYVRDYLLSRSESSAHECAETQL